MGLNGRAILSTQKGSAGAQVESPTTTTTVALLVLLTDSRGPWVPLVPPDTALSTIGGIDATS